MMKWFGVLLIPPLWGLLSTQFFIQAWLGIAQFFIHFIGFVKGAVPRKDNTLYMGVAIFNVVLFSILLGGGFWLLTDVLPFGQSQMENVVYWIFAGLSCLYLFPQIPSKIRGSWRYATVPGEVWKDNIKHKLGLN